MDEDFLDVTEKNNKKILIILVLLTLVILVGGYYFAYGKKKFALKEVDLEINSELSKDINFYLKKDAVDTSGYKLDISKVNTKEVGKYQYSIEYNNKVKKGTINVVDTKAPVFETKSLQTEVNNENFYIGDFLTKCEDASKPCLVSFKNPKDEEKLKAIGEYDIEILVSDVYNNGETAQVHLSVVEKGSITNISENDFEFASSSVELTNFNGEYFEKLEKALPKDGDEAHKKMHEISEINVEEYVNKTYPGYKLIESKVIEAYNKDSYIIGYIIKAVIDNGEKKEVYIQK